MAVAMKREQEEDEGVKVSEGRYLGRVCDAFSFDVTARTGPGRVARH